MLIFKAVCSRRTQISFRQVIKKTGIFTTNNTFGVHTNGTNQYEKANILFKEECYKINSCIYEVHKKLGTGFLEAVYQEALEIEFSRKSIPFIKQQELKILYDGVILSSKYIADLICYNKIIIEWTCSTTRLVVSQVLHFFRLKPYKNAFLQ